MQDVPSPSPSGDKSLPSEGGINASWREKPLVLVGLMGSGKSTIGRRLAAAIGWRFVDADEEIEAAAGCSIADLFAMYGEPVFRDLEARVITRLLSDAPLVLATGGGAWMQPELRARILSQATALWLKADLDVLVDRVSKRHHRPLLETGDKATIMQRLMEERYPVYALAQVTVNSGHGPHSQVVARAIGALEAMDQKASLPK